MRFTDAQHLQSEIGTVERFLAETPEDQIIMRKTWETRLEVLRERLAEVEARPQPSPLSIAFRGAPLQGSLSIDAGFAIQALEAFLDAITAVTTSVLARDRDSRGMLPGVGDRSLRIVDAGAGSFDLELPPPSPGEGAQRSIELEEARDPFIEGIEATFALIREAASTDEDTTSAGLKEVHPTAARKLLDFAIFLEEHNAWFAAEFQAKRINLDTPEAVQHVVKALNEDDIKEEARQERGELIGVLPESREFEARLETGEVVKGKEIGRASCRERV
jgi:hypothetical protein